MLTPEATKKICLMTKSEIGNSVRQYFIDIELAFYKFKNHIIESLNNKIKQLENNQKPIINSNKGIIYIFKALNTDLTLYKIGKTINAKKRFNSHNSPLANDIKIMMVYESRNITQLENCVKNFMKKFQYRKYKEIYEVDIIIIKKLIKKCDLILNDIDNEIKKSNNNLSRLKNEKLYMLIPQIK